MPDWIERVTEPRDGTRQLPEIPLTWEATTIPKLPESISSLPIDAVLSVTTDAIQIHAERVHSYPDDEGVEEVQFLLRKEDVVGVDIIFMPGIADGTDMQYVSLSEFSRAIIRHRDPFDVVPFFETTFTAVNPYWLKALAKAVKERLGVKVSVTEA
jgi:hypothetical protein